MKAAFPTNIIELPQTSTNFDGLFKHFNVIIIIIIIIIIITQIYNARNVIITILKHHKMNLRRGQFAG